MLEPLKRRFHVRARFLGQGASCRKAVDELWTRPRRGCFEMAPGLEPHHQSSRLEGATVREHRLVRDIIFVCWTVSCDLEAGERAAGQVARTLTPLVILEP